MGDPIAAQFSDRDAFAHLFCTWYVDHRPDCAWVVDDGGGGVLGYLIGSPDGGADDRGGGPDGVRHVVEFAIRYGIGHAVFVRRGTAPFIRRAARDIRSDRRSLHAPVDRTRFPADLHINLLPAARGEAWERRSCGRGPTR